MQSIGQRWITTSSHTSTLVLLPLLTYIITNVISGNIALSLGMVGALSIVRFRHPVRSPLELSVYFGAITMGIAASVSLKWLFLLVGSVAFAIIILMLMQCLTLYFLKKPFFSVSFSEGNQLSALDITSLIYVSRLDESNFLTMKRVEGKNIQYVLTSSDFKDLLFIEKTLKGDKNIISYQLNK
ncbi:DUF4956 domain-containing protein [Pseudomonadota bacterium]|nr:DUF4956 domain-containing protein [Pseudomonadota bacterium]